MYKGKRGDKFCALCGGKVKVYRCYNGCFDRQTGKKLIDRLVLCDNSGCYGKRPDDLMIAEDR